MGYSDKMKDSSEPRFSVAISIDEIADGLIEVFFDGGSVEDSCTAEFNAQDLDTFISKLQEARKAIT